MASVETSCVCRMPTRGHYLQSTQADVSRCNQKQVFQLLKAANDTRGSVCPRRHRRCPRKPGRSHR